MPRYSAALLGLALVAALPRSQAAEDDTRLLLERTRRDAAQQASAPPELAIPPGTLVHEGQRYAVEESIEALEPAIYIAINTGQWASLEHFIGRYRALPAHRPAVVAMAEGMLAREQGQYPRALRHMQQAREADPQDTRIQLESARLFFEDNQDRQARSTFAQALRSPGLPEQGRHHIQHYLDAIDTRNSWHGGFAFGAGHASNINQANGDRRCLSMLMGVCLNERKMPDAISSRTWNYEISLERRLNLGGNHNLLLRPLSYGTHYDNKEPSAAVPIRDYSHHTTLLYAGYQYLNARDSISVLPYAEHYYRDRHSDYLAGGLQLEWRHALNARWQLSGTLDAKRYHHSDHGQRLADDYTQYQGGLSVHYAPAPSSSLYAGVDVVRKKHFRPQASSRETALRAGVFHGFSGSAGVYLNLLGIYRTSRHDAHDGFLGNRRHDRQQVYIASLGAQGWKLAGLSPELRLRHTRNTSNIDWAFGFRQTDLSVQLRKQF